MPLLLIIVPVLAMLALNIMPRRAAERIAFYVALATAATECALAFAPFEAFWAKPIIARSLSVVFWFASFNLTKIMALSISIAAMTSLFVVQSSIKDKARRFNFISLLLLSMAGMNGVVLAGDLFTMYIYLEIVSAASFILIAFDRERDGYEGAFKYLLLSAVATALILAACGMMLMIAPSLSFPDIASAITGENRVLAMLVIAVLIVALFIKSGIVPFHAWLPDAYQSAPAPVSVLLAGIVTKTVGIYTMIRIFTTVTGLIPQVQHAMILLGLVSIFVGAIAAIGQRDMKRMLAYSSISQMGYIVAAIGLGSGLGYVGALLHFFNHATFKALLFTNVEAVEQRTGTRDMQNLGGVAQKMPITGFCSAIGFLSTAGIPPLSGFWSKFFIVLGAWEAGFHMTAVLMILASLITLAYFLIMQRRVFFGKLRLGLEGIREADIWITIPSVALTLVIVGVGLLMPWLFGSFLVRIWNGVIS